MGRSRFIHTTICFLPPVGYLIGFSNIIGIKCNSWLPYITTPSTSYLLFSFSSLSRDPAKTRPPAWRQAWRSVWSSFVTLSLWPWNVNHPSNGSSSGVLPCSSFLLVHKPHPISWSPRSLCRGLCGVWQGWKCPDPGASSWLFRTCCRCSAGKSCPSLWDPMNCSTPGFPVLQ